MRLSSFISLNLASKYFNPLLRIVNGTIFPIAPSGTNFFALLIKVINRFHGFLKCLMWLHLSISPLI